MKKTPSEAGKIGYEKIKDKLLAHSKKLSIEAKIKYSNNPSICKNCGKIISYEKRKNKFCNSSCSATHNNLGSRKPRKNCIKYKFCLYCETLLIHKQKKFCSTVCQSNYHALYKINNKLNISSSSLKNFIINQREWKCENCRLSEWMGFKIVLEMHHIDGNYKNNDPKNLKLLCPNCHSITPTFKGKNKGKGRDFRK